MRIIVDTRLFHRGGIGTYLQNLIPALDAKRYDSRYQLFSLKEILLLPRNIPDCDIYWTPHFNGPILQTKAKQHVVTIHDLHPLDHTIPLHKWLYTKTVLVQVIKKADWIITVSEFSKGRILHYFPGAAHKITVIQPGCDHLDDIMPQPVSGICKPYYLIVGNNKPHKNRYILYEAQKLNPQLHFVIAEKHSPQELVWLYKNAQALIFPSTYEGWGLPPLEAMRLGCPVVASNAASIPEACGEGALYFDPHDPYDLCHKIEQLKYQRCAWIAKGKKQSLLCTWARAAREHRKLFASLTHK